MSKKKQRNGFFYFMLDMKEELRQQGRNVQMHQMSALAGPRWSQLPEAEKAAYNARAKHEKRMGHPIDFSTARTGRMDCMGELLSERRDPAAEKLEKRRKQKEFLKEILPCKKDIVLMEIYILDIQPLCELKSLENDRFLPCEMGMVKYSLANGVHKVIHSFIDPGPIPMGHRYEAQHQSDQTHNVPVGGFELSKSDYRKILGDIQALTNTSRTVKPMIFAMKDSLDRVEYQLQWMADKAGVELFVTELYELELLMIALDSIGNTLYPPSTLPSSSTMYSGMSESATAGPIVPSMLTEYQATELLCTTEYDYENEAKCDWHREREINFCSLAVVNKCRYVLSDHLCAKFHISITTRHLPEKTILPVPVTKPTPKYDTSTSTAIKGVATTNKKGVAATTMKGVAPTPIKMKGGRGSGIMMGGRGRGTMIHEPGPAPLSYQGRGVTQ